MLQNEDCKERDVKPTLSAPEDGCSSLVLRCPSTFGSQAVPPGHWLSQTGAQLGSSAGDSDNGNMV